MSFNIKQALNQPDVRRYLEQQLRKQFPNASTAQIQELLRKALK